MPDEQEINRREFISGGARAACGLSLVGMVGYLAGGQQSDDMVWQIDPHKCSQCGKCATECVLNLSAVKCVHTYRMCGYCDRCFAYFDPNTNEFNTAAENQTCPTGAIVRKFIEDPYYQYTFDEELCIGCGKCVEGCNTFGNGSIYLQVRHDRCLNCNQCDIALQCPADAFVRVPAGEPYLLKKLDSPE